MGSRFPLRFDRCPWCGSGERVVREAMAAEGPKLAEGIEIASRIAAVVLTNDQGAISSPTIKLLTLRYDNCIDCGREYLVSAIISSQVNPNFGVRRPLPQ